MPDFRSFVPQQRFQPTVAMAPDGARVAYSANTSGQFNLWWGAPDSGSRQLTRFVDDAVRRVAVSPDGVTVAVAVDHQGNEQYQILLVPVTGGEPRRLTTVPDRQFELADAPFTADGRYLLYTGNDRDEASRDLIVHDLRTDRYRRIETSAGEWGICSVSPDGRWLLVVRLRSNSETDLFLLDLDAAEGALEQVTPDRGEAVFWGGPWDPDSSGFLVLTTHRGEFQSVEHLALADRSLTPVLTPEWDVEQLAATPDGRVLLWSVNEGGISRLRMRRDGAEVDLPVLPEGVVSAVDLSGDGNRIALLLQGAARPADVVLVDVAAGTVRHLTDSRPEVLRTVRPVSPELVGYPTHDGREIPAWLYLPDGPGPFPFVLSVHGGPEAQERPVYAYSGLYQYLSSHGIGVLAPNVRGSTGYGKRYQRLILRDWGGAELGDLEHAAIHLRSTGYADPRRLAVFGGSFGGFAALSCLSRLPEYWAAGVSVVGPSNLVTFARSVPPTWRPLMRAFVGDPETEADFLTERSPITYVDRIVAPLMVVQGANDPRVARAESDQIVAALRSRGVEVRYDVYPDEGHGFTSRENEIRALGDVGAFLVRHLVGPGVEGA